MTGAVLAMLLAISAPAESAPEPAPPVKAPLEQAQDNLDRAEQIYAQSCNDRAYATYNDLCNELADQVHQYRVDLDRSEREAARRPKTATPAPKS